MKAHNAAFLDANRHFVNLIKSGSARNIPIDGFRNIMIEEFVPSYGSVDSFLFDQVAKLVLSLYEKYDMWLFQQEQNEKSTKVKK